MNYVCTLFFFCAFGINDVEMEINWDYERFTQFIAMILGDNKQVYGIVRKKKIASLSA